MSIHYSRWNLNTYSVTPYFLAHVPEDYPLNMVLMKTKVFRRLPPRLKELSKLAKEWAIKNWPHPAGIMGIEEWYDDEGYELSPDTGARLSKEEIEHQWEGLSGLDDFKVIDIPEIKFADPQGWQEDDRDLESTENESLVDRSDLTEDVILSDIDTQGLERTAKTYGVPDSWMKSIENEEALARTIMSMDGKPWSQIHSTAVLPGTEAAFAHGSGRGRWITIGGHPNPQTGVEHEDGFRVFIDDDGTVLKGKRILRGHNVRKAKSRFDKLEAQQHGKQQSTSPSRPAGPAKGTGVKGSGSGLGRDLGSGRRGDAQELEGAGDGMEETATRPYNPKDGAARKAAGQSTGDASYQYPGAGGSDATDATGTDDATDTAEARLDKINKRIERYTDFFRKKGQNDVAEWMDALWEHVNEVGVEEALGMLDEEKTGELSGKVQYRGTGYFDPADKDDQFVKEYLNRVGIVATGAGAMPDPGMPVYASAPLPEDQKNLLKPGDVGPGATNITDKLQESKLLPGLETTEDVDVLMGKPVDRLTPEVLRKFDETYGKGKWIIKSYGDQAFAGFGILFPQRVTQVHRDAKIAMKDSASKLKKHGYEIARDENGTAVGIRNTNSGQLHKFGSKELNDIPNERVKKLGRAASIAAQNETGVQLPRSAEDNLKQKYWVNLRWDGEEPKGITDYDGKNYDFNTPEYEKWKVDNEAAHHEVERAIWTGGESDVKFMVQPAFEAIGVSEADRAAGFTWETSREGRVHIAVKDGKASVIPYATLARREDSMPAVFADKEVKAMEKAAQDAIDALPESERRGQVYAPDVMRTKDGWKVVELNAAVEGGQSLWLEANPMVIDAYVSHMTGKDPAHVRFVRNVLRDRMKGSQSPVDLRKGGPTEQPQSAQPQATPDAAQPPQPTPTAPQQPIQPTPAPTTEHPTEDEAKLKGNKPKPPNNQGTAFSFNDEHPRKPAGSPDGGQFVKKGTPGGVRTVRHGKLQVQYSLHTNKRITGEKINLKNYKQQDAHSCGFVAALTIAKHLKSDITAKEVLAAVRPTVTQGVDSDRMIAALKRLGIKATYEDDLTVGSLLNYVREGTPVIVSVWPDEWDTDHWTVVQGFDEDNKKIFLTNHSSLSVKMFKRQWIENWKDGSTRGAGLVCVLDDDSKEKGGKKGAALSTDKTGREHKGKGEGGGQFTSKSSGGESKESSTSKKPSQKVESRTAEEILGEWAARRRADGSIGLIGYRGESKPGKDAINLGKLAATEGIGAYIAKEESTAAFFGKTRPVLFTEPKNPIVVDEEPLHILHETEEIMQPPSKSDSPWLAANKEAVRRTKTTDDNWSEKTQSGELQEALTEILRERGHDGVLVSSDGEQWLVVFTEPGKTLSINRTQQ